LIFRFSSEEKINPQGFLSKSKLSDPCAPPTIVFKHFCFETAKNLLKYGDSIEKISMITGLPLEKVQQLQVEI
jgi:hypothetical protein